MIYQEKWYKEALWDLSFSKLEKKVQGGDMDAFFQLGRLYLRTSKSPNLPNETWARLFPILVGHVNAGDLEGDIDWIRDFMWMACKTLGVLPDIPKSEVKWAYLDKVPEVTYSKSWEVYTLGSRVAGGSEDRGMVSDTGERVSFRGSNTPHFWDYHKFDLKMDLDDFLKELKDEGYSSQPYEKLGYLIRYLNQEEAQGEFGAAYNDEVYGGEVDDYHGMPLSTIVGGRLEISLPTSPHRDQILKWMAE